MAQVTLAKALKLKNRQARTVTQLQERITGSNSYLVGSEVDFDAPALYADLKVQVGRLVDIKAAINDANAPVQRAIYRLAEVKGLVSFLRTISTRRGLQLLPYGAEDPQEYAAQMTAAEVTAEIERYEREIDDLQDELDSHNATVRIEVDLPDDGM